MANDLTVYKTEHGEVTLSPEIIRKYLVPSGTNVSDQEVQLFLKLCQFQGLNPFLREVYLVKYGSSPANMVTGKEVFTKRAQANPNYAGLEAGITVMTNKGDLVRREGSMKLPGEVLIGGWAKVHIKGHEVSSFEEVSLDEYSGTGPLWKTKPATMIRKVAIVHALREDRKSVV
jgi:phage recombination protein Bet